MAIAYEITRKMNIGKVFLINISFEKDSKNLVEGALEAPSVRLGQQLAPIGPAVGPINRWFALISRR